MTDQTLTLYYAPMTRAERVKKLLDVFEIPHELKTLDYPNEEQKADWYVRDVHPLGQVPALKHGDHVVTESGAICLYLADLFPEKGMAPATGTPERGRYYEWFFLFQTTVERALQMGGDPEKADEARARVREVLTAVAPRIGAPHLLGEQFTAADVMLHTELTWAKMLGMYPDGIDAVDRFYADHAARMAWELPTPEAG